MAELLIDEETWACQFSDPIVARDKAEQTRIQAMAIGDHQTEGRALTLLANYECRVGIPQHAADLFRKAKGILDPVSDQIWISRADLGILVANLNQYDTQHAACQLKDFLLSHSDKLTTLDQAVVFNYLATHAFTSDELGSAFQYYYQALSLAEDSQCHSLIIQLRNSLGTCHMGVANFLEARQQFESALALAEVHFAPNLTPVIACNLALTLVELNENQNAFEVMQLYRKGIASVDFLNQGFIPAVYALTALKTQRKELALSEIEVAEKILLAIPVGNEDSSHLLQVQISWVQALMEQSEARLKRAITHVNKAFELLKLTPEPIYERSLILLAANLHAGVGDYQQAFRFHSAYIKILQERRLLADQFARLGLEASHELEKKPKAHHTAKASLDVQAANKKLAETNALLAYKDREIENLKKQIQEQAIRDTLTGLHNRLYMEEAMFGIMRLAHRQKKPISIAILDMDNFRDLNDRYGHSFADAILVTLADLLLKGSRDSDIVARYGGEEFCIAFVDMDTDLAKQRLVDILEAFKRVELSSGGLTLQGASFSAGIAQFPTDATTFDQLITLADCALSSVKERGGSQVVTYASLVG